MDVCDKVGSEDGGAKDAVASMIKRLAHRNANVQLYTLEVGLFQLLLHERLLMSMVSACQCSQPKLWRKNAPGACLSSIHGRTSSSS
jgi:signal transducing adaptor molecule